MASDQDRANAVSDTEYIQLIELGYNTTNNNDNCTNNGENKYLTTK